MAERKANPKIASKYFPRRNRIDTVQDRSGLYKKNDSVLMDAYEAWVGLDDFRRKARRNKRYVFDDHWGNSPFGCGRFSVAADRAGVQLP